MTHNSGAFPPPPAKGRIMRCAQNALPLWNPGMSLLLALLIVVRFFMLFLPEIDETLPLRLYVNVAAFVREKPRFGVAFLDCAL